MRTLIAAGLMLAFAAGTGFAEEAAPTVYSTLKPAAKPELAKPAPLPVAKLKAEAKKEDFKKVERTLKGTAVFIRKDSMAVEFAEGEDGGQEMLLAMDPAVKLVNAKKLSDIRQGDVVEVKYTLIYLPSKIKGQEPVVVSTTATQVAFVKRPAPPAQEVAS